MKITSHAFLIYLLLCAIRSNAQIEGTNVFLKGDYLEIGMTKYGAYGSDTLPPAGYHPTEEVGLSFVADAEMDGWDSGTNGMLYCGDYALAGNPYESFAIQMEQSVYYNTRDEYGLYEINGEIISYEETPDSIIVVWKGTIPAYEINLTQTTTLYKTKLYFITTIEVENESNDTIQEFYYGRSIDHDNGSDWAEEYYTLAQIISNPLGSETALIASTGDTYGCYLALGMKSYDARVGRNWTDLNNSTPADKWLSYGNSHGAYYTSEAIGLVYKATIPPSSFIDFSFAYIFSPDAVDEAISHTEGEVTTDIYCGHTEDFTIYAFDADYAKFFWDIEYLYDYLIEITNTNTGEIKYFTASYEPITIYNLDSCVDYAARILTLCAGDTLESSYQFFNTDCLENKSPDVLIYPNPSNGSSYLDIYGLKPGALKIEIQDISGRLINSETISCNENLYARFNIVNLESGVYFICISQEPFHVRKQIVLLPLK